MKKNVFLKKMPFFNVDTQGNKLFFDKKICGLNKISYLCRSEKM